MLISCLAWSSTLFRETWVELKPAAINCFPEKKGDLI
jgi:hypothetical protein